GKNAAEANLWATEMLVIVVPKGQYTMLEDWGGLLGMRASGSNSVVLEDVFVPDHMTFTFNRARRLFGDTVGSAQHNSNPLYAGSFNAFAEGSLAATSVGLAEAAIDELTRIVTSGKMPGTGGLMKMDLPEVQRLLGTAMAKTDMVRCATLRGGQVYMEAAERAVTKIAPFTNETSLRLDGMYHAINREVGDIIDMLLRAASTSSLLDGQRMQRYFRDAVMLRSRREQLENKALEISREYFAEEGYSQDVGEKPASACAGESVRG
ncbi:MAG: hypothetical protein AB7E55_25560, partial [Pigmentiphaga sp.]